ncbi:hypothetical protein C8R44DRAFT_891933 [Mycena epipterygia]|nr:hypothetical protein C8R44DRAFT_891933 [Mycena epipterygia]
MPRLGGPPEHSRTGLARHPFYRPSASAATPAPILTTTAVAPALNPTYKIQPTPAPTSPTVSATPASKLPPFLQSPARRDHQDPYPSTACLPPHLHALRPRAAAGGTSSKTPANVNANASATPNGVLQRGGAAGSPGECPQHRRLRVRRCAAAGDDTKRIQRRGHHRAPLFVPLSTRLRPRSTVASARARTLPLVRLLRKLGGGQVAVRLCGWFAHLAGSTDDSLAATGGRGAGEELVDKVMHYLLDGDAALRRSLQEIWFLGVRLPDWGPEDERRVAQAQHAHSHSHSISKSHSHSTSASAGELDKGA